TGSSACANAARRSTGPSPRGSRTGGSWCAPTSRGNARRRSPARPSPAVPSIGRTAPRGPDFPRYAQVRASYAAEISVVVPATSVTATSASPASSAPPRTLNDWYALAPGATCAYDRSPCTVRSATATVSSPSFAARTARYGVPPRQRGCAVTVTCGSVGGTSVRKTSSASSSVYQVSLVRATVFQPCSSSTWCVTDCQLPHVVCGKVTTPASAPLTV